MQDPTLIVIDDYLRSLHTDRDDEQFAHVSDVYGCDYASYSRRQEGYKPLRLDDSSIVKMRRGKQVEGDILDALQADYELRGYQVFREYRIAWRPHDGRGIFRPLLEIGHPITVLDAGLEDYVACKGCTKCEPTDGEMVGHVDFFATKDADRTLFEVKSTVFYGAVPKQTRAHYVEQTAAYGVAVDASSAHVIVECRASGRREIYPVDLDAMEPLTIARAKSVLERTDPYALEPPEIWPRYDWQCGYCDVPTCKKNTRVKKKKKAAA